MKFVKTLACSLLVTLSGAAIVPALAIAEARGNYSFQETSELERSAAALASNSRAWLKFVQELPVPAGKKDLFNDAIRVARLFQLDAIEVNEKTQARDYEEALWVLEDKLAVNYAQLSRQYRSMLRLFRSDRSNRRELQNKFRALRTTYFYTGQLLSEEVGLED